MKNSTSLPLACFFFLLLFNYCKTYGQSLEKPINKLYLELAPGATSGNGSSMGWGIQAVLKNDWVSSVYYHSIEMNPKNIPSDYKGGYQLLLIFPIPDEFPQTNLSILSFTGGKRFATGRKTWFTTEAGISVVKGEILAFAKQPVVSNFLGESSNYGYTKENKTSIGGMLKADFNWAFTPYVGLGAGAFANFSSIESPVGWHIKLIVGWLNTKKKQAE